jgi:hypothetical protein
MGQEDWSEVSALIGKSRSELAAAVGDFYLQLSELERLDQALEKGELDDATLKSAKDAFDRNPRTVPTKGATKIGDGLDVTRALVEKINEIILLREERRAGRG